MLRSNPDSMHDLAAPVRSRTHARPVWRPGARTLRRLVLAALLLALALGGFVWLRDSPLVQVREVFVTGVGSSQEARVREALRRTALGMTTLHVREDELRAAVAPFASVASLRVRTAIPNEMTIEVIERVPAAVVVAGGQRIPVAAGGLLLRGVAPSPGLPVLEVAALPAGPRLTERRPRAAVAILGGAPEELRGRIEQIRAGPRGLQIEMRDGPDLIFGSDARVGAKWAAATRVLADSDAQGAVYLDLRLPEWTAAGGVGPVEQEPSQTPVPTDPDNPVPQP